MSWIAFFLLYSKDTNKGSFRLCFVFFSVVYSDGIDKTEITGPGRQRLLHEWQNHTILACHAHPGAKSSCNPTKVGNKQSMWKWLNASLLMRQLFTNWTGAIHQPNDELKHLFNGKKDLTCLSFVYIYFFKSHCIRPAWIFTLHTYHRHIIPSTTHPFPSTAPSQKRPVSA